MEAKAIDYIRTKTEMIPDIGIILGSGLGDFADTLQDPVVIPYGEIPGFHVSTVKGHSGQLIFGTLGNKKVVAMKGRIHYYEGISVDQVVFPMKVLCELGVENFIITNASGGVNKNYKPGDLMIITDHINFGGVNPLIGPNDDKVGPRFPDMTYVYTPELQDLAASVGEKLNIPLQKGVYIYMTGPTYETPAEIRMARTMGADAVGMSTVPEAIIASHRKRKILGISCITNMAAGILDEPLKHEDVVEVSSRIKSDFIKLIQEIIQEM